MLLDLGEIALRKGIIHDDQEKSCYNHLPKPGEQYQPISPRYLLNISSFAQTMTLPQQYQPIRPYLSKCKVLTFILAYLSHLRAFYGVLSVIQGNHSPFAQKRVFRV
jgi:hypothetical protein